MLRARHIVCGLAVGGFVAAASADVVYNLNVEFSFASPPAGAPPWMTVTFAQGTGGNAAHVFLTLQNNLSGVEFVDRFLFNAKPANVPTPSSLSIAHDATLSDAGTLSSSIAGKASNLGTIEMFKADGDGYFDFRINWSNGAFTGTEKAVFKISNALESWFDDISEPGGGNGTFHAVAKIQGIDPNGLNNGWIGDFIPLPTSAGMAFAGLLGLSCVRRRGVL